MTEEHKQKIREGREKAKKEREASGVSTRKPRKSKLKGFKNMVGDKPVLYITGEEETGFDFKRNLSGNLPQRGEIFKETVAPFLLTLLQSELEN